MMMTLKPDNFVFASQEQTEYDYLGVARKSQYVLCSFSETEPIRLNGNNYVVNGNVH